MKSGMWISRNRRVGPTIEQHLTVQLKRCGRQALWRLRARRQRRSERRSTGPQPAVVVRRAVLLLGVARSELYFLRLLSFSPPWVDLVSSSARSFGRAVAERIIPSTDTGWDERERKMDKYRARVAKRAKKALSALPKRVAHKALAAAGTTISTSRTEESSCYMVAWLLLRAE